MGDLYNFIKRGAFGEAQYKFLQSEALDPNGILSQVGVRNPDQAMEMLGGIDILFTLANSIVNDEMLTNGDILILARDYDPFLGICLIGLLRNIAKGNLRPTSEEGFNKKLEALRVGEISFEEVLTVLIANEIDKHHDVFFNLLKLPDLLILEHMIVLPIRLAKRQCQNPRGIRSVSSPEFYYERYSTLYKVSTPTPSITRGILEGLNFPLFYFIKLLEYREQGDIQPKMIIEGLDSFLKQYPDYLNNELIDLELIAVLVNELKKLILSLPNESKAKVRSLETLGEYFPELFENIAIKTVLANDLTKLTSRTNSPFVMDAKKPVEEVTVNGVNIVLTKANVEDLIFRQLEYASQRITLARAGNNSQEVVTLDTPEARKRIDKNSETILTILKVALKTTTIDDLLNSLRASNSRAFPLKITRESALIGVNIDNGKPSGKRVCYFSVAISISLNKIGLPIISLTVQEPIESLTGFNREVEVDRVVTNIQDSRRDRLRELGLPEGVLDFILAHTQFQFGFEFETTSIENYWARLAEVLIIDILYLQEGFTNKEERELWKTFLNILVNYQIIFDSIVDQAAQYLVQYQSVLEGTLIFTGKQKEAYNYINDYSNLIARKILHYLKGKSEPANINRFTSEAQIILKRYCKSKGVAPEDLTHTAKEWILNAIGRIEFFTHGLAPKVILTDDWH